LIYTLQLTNKGLLKFMQAQYRQVFQVDLNKLQKISGNELAKFSKQKFSAGGINIGKNETENIIAATECHPYYFQMLCNILWETCQEHGRIT